MKIYISLIYCLFFSAVAIAQVTRPINQIDTSSVKQDTITSTNPADTTNKVFYFYLKDLKSRQIGDNFNTVHRINPVLSGDFQHQYLGNFGSAHYGMIYQPRIRRGFDMGYHSYDGYLITQKDVPFYNVEKPHTDAFFSAATQEDAFIDVKFSSNTSKRSNSYLAYKRISHIGSYTNQQVRHTNYVTSTYWRSKRDNYLVFFSWAGNTIKQKNNGGIPIDTLLDQDIYLNRSRKLIPVNIESAQSEYDNHEITLTQYFSFAALKRQAAVVESDTTIITDSLGLEIDTIIKKRRVSSEPMIQQAAIPSKTFLSHQFSYRLEQIKFFDDNVSGSSDYYGDFLTNPRGIRHYISAKRYENQFKANLKLASSGGAELLLQPGLIYALYFINQEPIRFTRNDLFLTARLQTKIKEYFDLDANGLIGFGSKAGDYSFSGKLSTGIKDKATLAITVMQQLYQPTLIQERLYVSENEIWNTPLDKTLETNIGGELTIPFLKLRAGAGYHVFDDFIYFDENAKPAQVSKVLNIVQAYGKHKLQLGKFHFDNELAFQVSPDTFYKLPNIVSRHNWYYENYFFKAKSLLGQIGVEMRYNSNYRGNSYMPVSGQFYIQDDVELISFYPITDVYINAKVRRFFMFIKAENVIQPMVRKSYLTSVYYPGRDLFVRFGISWRLID